MDISEKLRTRLQELSFESKGTDYNLQSSIISEKYRNNHGGLGGILSSKAEILTYAQVRMPATFACIKKVVSELNLSGCASLLDVGSGTGAGILAICDKCELNEICAIESQSNMIEINKMIVGSIIDTKVDYRHEDVLMAKVNKKYDVVLAGFVFNELNNDRQIKLIERLWECTGKYLIIVDPGKPENYNQMMQLKKHMFGFGVEVVAPCANKEMCPLCDKDDWCHFIARVRRSSIHRAAKQGSSGYEDEKFTYLVFSKEDKEDDEKVRIIRRPTIAKGKIIHTLCTKNGIEKHTFTKSQKDVYKQAKDLEVGQCFNYKKVTKNI